jgi:hypothetical protein
MKVLELLASNLPFFFLYNLVGRPILMWQLGAWSEGKSGPFTP